MGLVLGLIMLAASSGLLGASARHPEDVRTRLSNIEGMVSEARRIVEKK